MPHHPLIRAAAKISKIKAADIVNSRQKEPTAWRQVAMAVLRDSGMTYAEIAAATKRDHSTVYSNCQKLSKVKQQQWFVDMKKKLLDHATDDETKRVKREALDKFFADIPPIVYQMAWSSLY